MAGETHNQITSDRLLVVDKASQTIATSIIGSEIELGKIDPRDFGARENTRRHARLGARVMLESLIAMGVDIPTELLASDRFEAEIVPGMAHDDSIQPTADRILKTVDRILVEEAQDEARKVA